MIRTLQSLRLIFILLVLFSHLSWGDVPPLRFGGECGVSFFFMLSGFVLSIGYGAKIEEGRFSLKTFYLKQLAKCYPLHLLTLLAFALLDLHNGYGVQAGKLLANALLLQSWIPDNGYNFSFNGVAWFLSDIMFFYLLFPWLYSAIRKMPGRALASTSAAVALLYVWLVVAVPQGLVNTVVYVFPPVRVVDFTIGILLYRLYASRHTSELRLWISHGQHRYRYALAEMLPVGLMVAVYLLYGELPKRIHATLLFMPILPAVIYAFAVLDASGGRLTRLLQNSWLTRGGGLSLEVYMTHILVIRGVTGVLVGAGIDLGYAATALACVAMTLVTALATKKYFVDKLYLALKKHVIKP